MAGPRLTRPRPPAGPATRIRRAARIIGAGAVALVLLGGVPLAVRSAWRAADDAVAHHAGLLCLRQAAAEGRAVRRVQDPTIVDGPKAGCPDAGWIRWSEMEATPPPAPTWGGAFLDALRILLSGVVLVAAAGFALPWATAFILGLYLKD